MGTHLKELSEIFPMNTNMTGFGWFSKIFASLYLDENSLSIGRVNQWVDVAYPVNCFDSTLLLFDNKTY